LIEWRNELFCIIFSIFHATTTIEIIATNSQHCAVIQIMLTTYTHSFTTTQLPFQSRRDDISTNQTKPNQTISNPHNTRTHTNTSILQVHPPTTSPLHQLPEDSAWSPPAYPPPMSRDEIPAMSIRWPSEGGTTTIRRRRSGIQRDLARGDTRPPFLLGREAVAVAVAVAVARRRVVGGLLGGIKFRH